MLELGSGSSPHLEELARRGYKYLGLDINEIMLSYSQKRAKTLGISATFIQADMRKFTLEKPVDFVYVMLGSLYAKSTEDLLSHFDGVALALNPGGLYLLDWCVNFHWGDQFKVDDSWTMEKEEVKVNTRFVVEEVMDRARQISKHKLLADVDDHGKILHLETVGVGRTIFPQEFLLLVEKSKRFEFIGWWNNWNLEEPLEKADHIERPIILIRRI